MTAWTAWTALTAANLNEALSAYVHTLPQPARLAQHLAERGLAEHREQIQAVLDAAIEDTGNFLWSQAGGVTWNAGFEEALFTHLAARHPWLDRAGFKSLLAYGGWLCWHEGLNADVSVRHVF